VPPSSPFVPHPPPHLHPQPHQPLPLQPHPHQHTHRTPASPFSPQESHSSNSVSPISQPLPGQQQPVQISDPALAAAVHPLHLGNLPTHILDHSHPSRLSSPHHSPHPNGGPSPHNPFFPFNQAQALSRRDLQPLHVQAQLPHRTTPPHHSAVSVEDLDWYYPHQRQQRTPTDTQNWSAHHQDMAPPMPLTPQSAVDTTHHFLSTHRRSPATLSSRGSDPSLDSTMMTANGSAPPQVGRSLDPNLGDSPSWNSAMTSMPIHQLDHFYPFQQSRAAAPQPRAQIPHQRASRHSQSPMPPPRSNSSTGISHQYVQGLRPEEAQQMRAFQAQAQAAQAQQQARAEAQQARVHAQQQQQDEFSPSTPTSSNTTNSVHQYSGTSYPHLQYFGVEQPQHLLPYGQSQAETGQGQTRTPPQGQAQGLTPAPHAATARPTLVVNAPIKFDSRSLLPTPPLHLE
jgi:hypothetical protein